MGAPHFLIQIYLNLFDYYINGDEIVIGGPRKDRFESRDDYSHCGRPMSALAREVRANCLQYSLSF